MYPAIIPIFRRSDFWGAPPSPLSEFGVKTKFKVRIKQNFNYTLAKQGTGRESWLLSYCIITIFRSQSISVLIMRVSLVLSLVSLSTSSAFVHQRSIIVQPQTSFSLTNHNVKSPFQTLPTTSYSNNVVKFSSTARKESAVPGLVMDGSKLLLFVLY